ncbi:hypothetical protein H072_6427 [Dactylellina haptotyla CBS 200.50]|uniref:CBM1 domain-containing protein n=1 Tax=Dactylellina haptotyla (strain CBS 200.50) TaxID=1284197 RepID=S8AFR3_DACHA|nr:hypothetical protein H072_6427 [Dactylellina haptotyla CBS 200.50]
MRFQSKSSSGSIKLAILISSVYVSPCLAWGGLFGGWSPWRSFGGFKRDLEGGELQGRDWDTSEWNGGNLFPGLEQANGLEKRQADCPQCYFAPTITYVLSSTETYMATPYGGCTIGGSTSNLCPTDFACACQTNSTSICIPTTVAPATPTCTPYTGPVTTGNDWTIIGTEPSDTSVWIYTLSSLNPSFADPSGQCGGTIQNGATTWDPAKTKCPSAQRCACINTGLSTCINTNDANYRGTECPNTCKYEFTVSLPAPSETAKLNAQCGGSCWNGPTNCPSGASCRTESSPTSGAFAACVTTGGFVRMKVRSPDGGYEVVDNLPAQVRAVATPVLL